MSLPWRGWLAVAVLTCAAVTGGAMLMAAPVLSTPPTATPEPSTVPRFSIRAVGDYDEQWFDVDIQAGETVELTAAIRNVGDAEVALRTYAANAFNPVNGGFSAGSEDIEPAGPTRWLGYPAVTFHAAPSEERHLTFTVTVPSGTPPGEYVTALVVQTAEPQAISGTTTFEQIIRNTVSVEITVPGEMSSGFALGPPVVAPAGEDWAIDVPITNTGTARVRPGGQLVVTTPGGEEVTTSHVKMGSVYGGNTTNVRTVLPGQLPLGDYLVSVDLTDPETGATSSIRNAPVTLAEPEEAETPMFVVAPASVMPNGDPVQFVNVSATITNNGQTIPTANVTLNVQRDSEPVESYPLAENLALAHGGTTYDQRYIPLDGWQPGTYTFQLVVASVSGGTETILATIDVPDEIVVP